MKNYSKYILLKEWNKNKKVKGKKIKKKKEWIGKSERKNTCNTYKWQKSSYLEDIGFLQINKTDNPILKWANDLVKGDNQIVNKHMKGSQTH